MWLRTGGSHFLTPEYDERADRFQQLWLACLKTVQLSTALPPPCSWVQPGQTSRPSQLLPAGCEEREEMVEPDMIVRGGGGTGGTLSISGITEEATDAQVVAPPGNTRVVRDVFVQTRGSLDSGLGIARYDDDDSDVSSDSTSTSSGSGISVDSPVLDGACEMTVTDITVTDGSANIGIFKNYVSVFLCDGQDPLPGFPGAESLPASVLKDAQQAKAWSSPYPYPLQNTIEKKTSKVEETTEKSHKPACWDLGKLLRWPWAFVPSAAVSLIILLIVVNLTLLPKPPPKGKSSDPPAPIILPNGIEYASREVWQALPPKRKMPGLILPSTSVIVHHTATSACYTTKVCIEKVAAMQLYQMDSEGRNWADLGYNFLVGGDGVVYEARGWENTGGHFEKEIWAPQTIGIAVIGDYVRTSPDENQLEQLRKFISWAVTVGKIEPDYKLYGVCQLMATKSPGLLLMAQLRTWPHWDHYVTNPNVSCTE